MRIGIVEPARAWGEALAKALIGDPITSAHHYVSLEEFVSAEARFHHDLVVVAGSAGRDVHEWMHIAAQFPTMRVVLFDKHHVADRTGFCQANGIQYQNQDCSLTELRSALIGKGGEQSASDGDQPKHGATIPSAENVPVASQSSQLASLTPREVQVLRLVARGYSVLQCAEALGLSHSTVDNHKSRMMAKLGVHKSIELVYRALREGLVDLNDPLD